MVQTVRSVLVVDDDAKLLAGYERGFAAKNVRVFAVANSAAARQVARTERPDLAIVDLRLGNEWGIDLLVALKADVPEIRVILVSGVVSVASTVAAMRAGAEHVLMKPVMVSQILSELDRGGTPVDREAERLPSLARVEWEHLMKALADANGNVSETARRLGIHRQSLQRKLKKHPPTR